MTAVTSSRWADLHVYDTATMRCRACGDPWVCADGQQRLLDEFRYRSANDLEALLAETAAIGVQVLGATSPEEITAVHFQIRGWVPEGLRRG